MKQTFVILDLRLALRALLPCALLTGLHLATPCQAALLNWQALAPLVSTMPGASAGPVGSASAPDLSALERRSGQGDTRAQAALGWHHLRPALEALASEDLAAAQHNAAQLQSAGRFAEPLRQGRYWLQRAANAGRHEAELLLGYCYLLGLGTPLQPDTGWDWVRKAADQGFGPAQYLLGSAYLSGEGLRENVFLGLFYIAQAANQGQAEAKRLRPCTAWPSRSAPQRLLAGRWRSMCARRNRATWTCNTAWRAITPPARWPRAATWRR
jgi:Sel1 repeat